MFEKVKLRDFDVLGIINLTDVSGIEKYVTKLSSDSDSKEYLSRSKEYYNVKSMTELACEREELRDKLSKELSKRNFVIIENMLNCSAKVYFTKFEEYIRSKKDEKSRIQLEQAEKCLMEDTKNILAILSGKGTIEVDFNNRLPSGSENCALRAIEMDNKAALYIFAKALQNNKNPNDVEVITPGYGSIYIGPFLKAMYGYNFTNVFKSKYIEEVAYLNQNGESMKNIMSSERPYQPEKTVLLLDDNIGTGATMQELKKSLLKEGIPSNRVFSGAVQYNWRNYYRVTTGEKIGIDRFEVDNFDFITPMNYAGHKLFKRAIASLISSGKNYIDYLNSKHYRISDECDLKGTIYRGMYCAKEAGLQLGSNNEDIPNRILKQKGDILPKYSKKDNKISNPISLVIIEKLIKSVKEIEMDKENANETKDNDFQL